MNIKTIQHTDESLPLLINRPGIMFHLNNDDYLNVRNGIAGTYLRLAFKTYAT